MQTKFLHLTLALCCALGAVTATAQTPTVSTNVIAESSVQWVAPGSSVLTSFTNFVGSSNAKYNKVKASSLGATTTCKTYFKFDFTGQNPNTNNVLKFSFPFVANNLYQHLNLWVLNQAYTGFTTNGQSSFPAGAAVVPTLSWAGAQANNTNNNTDSLVTSGPATATLITDFVDSGGATGSAGVSLPAPWGQYLINNQVVIVLTGTNDASNSGNGARFALGNSTATFQPLNGQPPTITAIPPQTVRSTTPSSLVNFTVGDPVDPATSLNNITVTLGNTNVTLTSQNIAAGAGGSRTLTFTPVSNLAPGVTATVTVTVTVTDSLGNSASSSFLLTVPPFISLPVVVAGTNFNYLPPTNLLLSAGAITIPFQVVDTNVAASSLVVTGAISAYSTNISSISFTSSPGIAPNTNNCTLTVNVNGAGVGIVNLQIIDPANGISNAAVNLAVMALPDGSYAVYDAMNYQPSTSISSSSGHANLFNVSANLWAPRSTVGSVNLITSLSSGAGGAPIGVPMIRGSTSGNPNQLRLAGAPYLAGSHKVLFASLNVQWADLSFYGANLVYPGNSIGGFVEFAADATATGAAMAQVCTVTNAADTATNLGTFYLALYNGTNSPSVFTGYQETIPDAQYGNTAPIPNSTPDNVVIGYDVDTGVSQLWVNQASSAGTSVSLQEVAATNLANVSYLVLLQNGGMGDILVESASVKVVTKAVPTITGISQSGANQYQIKFTSAPGSGGSASVVGAATVNGTYSTVASNINESPANSGNFTATVTGSGDQMFYKITQAGGTPAVTFPF